MEEKQNDVTPLKKKHFLKLHERIQNKYHEMQRKLEKSKSVDSLSTTSDDYSYKEQLYTSNVDIREYCEVSSSEPEVENCVNIAVLTDNIHKQNATSEVIVSTELNFAESENVEEDWERIEPDSIDTRVSLESLNEVGKESDDSSSLPTPSPRTIRDRIGSRFAAAKERRERKREEKEKILKEKRLKEKKDSREKVEKLILSNSSKDVRFNKKNKTATVSIALIEATKLIPISEDKMRLLQCRFRLGTEKYKSKVVKSNGADVKWQELFNLNMYDDLIFLEITLWDKDNFMGRAVIDLAELEREKTHKLKIDVVDEKRAANLFILLTISGISTHNTVADMEDVQKAQSQFELRKKAWYRIDNKKMTDVGLLSIILYGAKGLVSQDCYCVLKLGNERLQTHTEYKTNDPSWMKIFNFQLSDITSLLEISIVDEKKLEEIGKISVPLLRINNGVKVWYALKDHTQRERARGNNPRILLEMRTTWSIAKAAIRVINPKEVDLLAVDAKFDRRVFARNIVRARAVTNWTLNSLKFIKTCFEWESRKSNVTALIIWTLFCYFFKIWMLPLLILIPFFKYRPETYYLVNWRKMIFKSKSVEIVEDKVEKEEKSTLRQKIHSLQEMVHTVQNGIGKVASVSESIKNLFNFTVPFVSFFAVILILIISLVMFLIPVKYMLICWGFHKFTRKILRPNRVPNSEILDLLSRVPDDETLLDCEELPLEETLDEDTF